EILTHALHLVRRDRARIHRALRVRADDVDVGLFLLEIFRDPADRAARAHAGDENVDPALGLLPDLGPGRLVVRFGVALLEVLVGLKGAGERARQAGGNRVVGLGRRRRDGGGAGRDGGAVTRAGSARRAARGWWAGDRR